MKQIKVKTCSQCPYIEHNNGAGFTEPFTMCDKFGILLIDKTYFDIHNLIHQDCRLDDYKE